MKFRGKDIEIIGEISANFILVKVFAVIFWRILSNDIVTDP